MKELALLYKDQYQKELLDSIIPFWEKNSPDREYGGYFTCLERDGKVFDTDKFMWLQGRQVWFFSMIYNQLEPRPEWMEMALLGARFMEKYGMDTHGNWYFSLTRDGKPLVQPYNIFSDCFACMGFAELFKATGEAKHKEIAVKTFRNIQIRTANPKGVYNKLYPGARPMKSFSLPMIMCNLSLILEDIIGKDEVDKAIKPLIGEVMDVFYQKDSGIILENVAPDGSTYECFEGRLVNPGHTNEAMWFMMDLAERYADYELMKKATGILLRSTEYGWDEKYGGIFYFKDIKGYPPQQLEWDQKLWWVHIETLIALVKAYKLTGDSRCKDWFIKIHDYTWEKFRDNEFPEWYGYLTRQGTPLLTLKGGKWKGCFHVPRGLYQIWKIMEKKD
jgi:N-acylglucosamine 2-epimerase